jgi:hypothetical protein
MSVDKATPKFRKFFANSVDAMLVADSGGGVAEGTETEVELCTLQALGGPCGQGFHMGPPDHIMGGIRSIYRFC